MNNQIDKVRILYVIDGLEFGGGERVFLQLATGLRNRLAVCAAAMPGRRFAQEINEKKISFRPVDMSKRLSLKPIFQLTKIISTEKIELIHSQGARADFFARVAGRIASVPYILCTIAAPVERFDVSAVRKSIYRLLDRLTEHYVNRFIVVSDSLKYTLIRLRGIPSDKVIRIYNGIELEQYRPQNQPIDLRNEWGFSKDTPLIAAIGRMVWEKGLEYFLQSIPEIMQHVPNTRVLLVGDGPLRKNLESLAKELNLEDKVTFTGFRSDIRYLLSNIDILVIPSIFEGFPMITLEAMAMRKPIVATRIDGITEQIVDGKEGLLVPPRNPKALAATVLKLIHDRNLTSQLAAAAREKVENSFSVEKMLAETKALYYSLLEEHYTISKKTL
jgi:glycosyltransferase involved in cell wall biosynthesis